MNPKIDSTTAGGQRKKKGGRDRGEARSGLVVTDALRGEHGVLRALLDYAERAIPVADDMEQIRVIANVLDALLVSHADLEDALLLIPMRSKIGGDRSIGVFMQDHREIQSGIAKAATGADLIAAKASLNSVLGLARDHFEREERMLFPSADETVEKEESSRLAGEWAQRRGVYLPGSSGDKDGMPRHSMAV
ncbi:MAG: hemerythrin domain-containing protein [Euryarchaeota archaeon]|nr:hemerythrin domain-containing protein [Euryarchaeota archaeon]